MKQPLIFVSTFCLATAAAMACDLCAISNADSARADYQRGVILSVSEQFTSFGTVQFESQELPASILDDGYLDNSILHLVPGFNFSPRIGLSLNIPIIHRRFHRFELTPTGITTENGTVSGLGDISLISRWKLLDKSGMKSSIAVNLLAGVKFPTGDTSRIRNQVEKGEALKEIYGGSGHQHEIGGVHEHELALGSGSFDAVGGLTLSSRWQRWFFNALVQYNYRTEGAASFRFGDEFMISGGPGAFIFTEKEFTLSLQANAGYETEARVEYLGSKSDNTGMTVWYLGPQMNFTWGEHLSVNAGVDIPLSISNNGLQNVPDYRIHGGISWRF